MSFFTEALSYANEAHAQTAVPVSVILAQWAIETGYGGYDWSVAHNPGNVGSFDNQPVNRFATLALGVQAYIQTMNLGYYDAVRSAPNWEAACVALGRSPWASSHYTNNNNPGSLLIEVVEQYSLTLYDGPEPDPEPTPSPSASPEEILYMFTRDTESGGFWATDANGDNYAENGAPFIPGLNTHPAWNAGSAESGNANPVVGLTTFTDANGQCGLVYVTKPQTGTGGPVPYEFYRIARNGQPD